MFPNVSERRENGTGLSQEPVFARRRRWHWALLLPLINLVWIVLFLSDYTNVWVAPEAIVWRAELSANRTLGETVRFAFNWSALESAPRVSRPLSNLFETADSAVRKRLWRSWTPHPALSLTYLFTLIVAPVLLFAVLRALGIRDSLAWCGAALYLSNPGTLSLLAIGFRPGKAMACAAMVAVLWWASRLKKVSFVHIVPLY